MPPQAPCSARRSGLERWNVSSGCPARTRRLACMLLGQLGPSVGVTLGPKVGFTTTISSFRKLWRVPLALLQDMSGLGVNLIAYNAALEVCRSSFQWDAVLDLLKAMGSTQHRPEPWLHKGSTALVWKDTGLFQAQDMEWAKTSQKWQTGSRMEALCVQGHHKPLLERLDHGVM